VSIVAAVQNMTVCSSGLPDFLESLYIQGCL
jgi:hypothetical protein